MNLPKHKSLYIQLTFNQNQILWDQNQTDI